ncbi:MAG: hypothetical protein F9K24_14610 [Leptonema illini]|uniref:Ankyrin repeat domain-containing protein n=1 Tax=Leptonema illini TaxID=183 RepID=A0A833GZY6_9LEPT|nr:MAG: hypothetical protein F9K24_14610 [Leptonema illini]
MDHREFRNLESEKNEQRLTALEKRRGIRFSSRYRSFLEKERKSFSGQFIWHPVFLDGTQKYRLSLLAPTSSLFEDQEIEVDEDDADVLPLAFVDRLHVLGIKTASELCPVLIWNQHDFAFRPLYESLDLFLSALLKKGEASGFDRLNSAVDGAEKLCQSELYSEASAILQPVRSLVDIMDGAASMQIRDLLRRFFNLSGIANLNSGRIESGIEDLRKGVERKDPYAALNLVEHWMANEEHGNAGNLCDQFLGNTLLLDDHTEFYLLLNLGVCQLYLNERSSASATFKRIKERYYGKDELRIAVERLQSTGEPAEEILIWFLKEDPALEPRSRSAEEIEETEPAEPTVDLHAEMFSAMKGGRIDAVKAMVEAGADVNAKDSDFDRTLLHILFTESSLSEDARLSFADYLIEKGADLYAQDGDDSNVLVYVGPETEQKLISMFNAKGRQPELQPYRAFSADLRSDCAVRDVSRAGEKLICTLRGPKKKPQLVDALVDSNHLAVSNDLYEFLISQQIEIQTEAIEVRGVAGAILSDSYRLLFIPEYDCLNVERSEPEFNRIDPSRIRSVKRLIVDRSRLPDSALVFRVKGLSQPVIVDRMLSDHMQKQGFTGIQFTELKR